MLSLLVVAVLIALMALYLRLVLLLPLVVVVAVVLPQTRVLAPTVGRAVAVDTIRVLLVVLEQQMKVSLVVHQVVSFLVVVAVVLVRLVMLAHQATSATLTKQEQMGRVAQVWQFRLRVVL
jgi:hypothetical protein